MRLSRLLSLLLILIMTAAELTSCRNNESGAIAPKFSQEINLDQPLNRIGIAA
jgi:hypothetical protein